MNGVYPWQQRAWDRLEQAFHAGQFPHALLLHAPAGAGLESFAHALAGLLLGVAAKDHQQVLLDTGAHPDSLRLEPEEQGKAIKVDAVRSLIDFIHLTAQYGQYKVAVLLPAEAMNRNAANSLLKTLEEPPANSVIILVSTQPAMLPITIRSRCQHIDLTPRAEPDTLAWLAEQTQQADPALLFHIAGAAPLAALELDEEQGLPLRNQLFADLESIANDRLEPLQAAEQWNKLDIFQVHVWLLRLVRDLLRCHVSGPAAIVNSDLGQRMQHLTSGRSLRQVIQLNEQLIQNYHLLTGPFSPNRTALLEDFILAWQTPDKTEVGLT